MVHICLQGYKPIDGITKEPWEESDDDHFYQNEKCQHTQNDVKKKGGSQGPEGKHVEIAMPDYHINTEGHNTNEIGFDKEVRWQTGTENVNGLRECTDISPKNLEHDNKQQAPAKEVSDLSCQKSLRNEDVVHTGNSCDTKRKQELKQTARCLEGENTSAGQQISRSQNVDSGRNEDFNSYLTDEEILAKYRERNQYRRWSQPSWRMSPRSSGTDWLGSERIGKEKELFESIYAKRNKQKTDTDMVWRDGEGENLNEYKLTTAKRAEGSEKVEITYTKEGTKLHPNENASENVVLRMNESDGNEDVNKPREDLWQQWSISKRKSTQADGKRSDENLSSVSQLKDERKMEVEMPRASEKGVEKSIIYFNYGTDSKQTFSDCENRSESLSPTDVKHGNTDKLCQQQLFVDYGDDIDYDTLTDDFHYNGTESNREILAKKTDEMLQG